MVFRGLVFDAGNLTVGKWAGLWLRDAVADTVRPVTYAKYEQIVRNHIKPSLGRLTLKQAVSDALAPRNVCAAVKPPGPEKREVSPLSPEQARRSLEACWGERLGLHWEDGAIRVSRSL